MEKFGAIRKACRVDCQVEVSRPRKPVPGHLARGGGVRDNKPVIGRAMVQHKIVDG